MPLPRKPNMFCKIRNEYKPEEKNDWAKYLNNECGQDLSDIVLG